MARHVTDARCSNGDAVACADSAIDEDFTFFCAPGELNNMAKVFFTGAETAIRNLFHSRGDYTVGTLAVFFSVYWTLVTWHHARARARRHLMSPLAHR